VGLDTTENGQDIALVRDIFLLFQHEKLENKRITL